MLSDMKNKKFLKKNNQLNSNNATDNQARLQDSVIGEGGGGGHKQIFGQQKNFNTPRIRECGLKNEGLHRNFPRILGRRPKKKVFTSKIARISTNFGVKLQKKGILPQKLRKNSSCSRILG